MTDHELSQAIFGSERNASLAAVATGTALEDQDGDMVRVRLDGTSDSADGEVGILMPCAVTNIKAGTVVQVLMSRTTGEVGFTPLVLGNANASRIQDELTEGVNLKFESTMEDLGVSLESGVTIGPGAIATYVTGRTADKVTRTELEQTDTSIRTYVSEQMADKVTSSQLEQTSSSIRSYVSEQVADKVTSTQLTQTSSALELLIQGAQGTADDALDAASAAISGTDVQYAQNSSRTTAPTSGWSSSAPSWQSGKYIWQRVATTLADGTVSYSTPVCISGRDGQDGRNGQDGDDGDAGIGVSAIVEQYYLSSSSTTQTGGSWSTAQPAWSSGKYIWTRSKITWTDGTTTYTTPVLAKAINSANENAAETMTLVRAYSGGVLVCKSGNSIGTLVNANGSFDVVKMNGLTPTGTIAKFGTSAFIGEGNSTYSYEGAVAVGTGLRVGQDNQVVVGAYNQSRDDACFVVGGGTSSSNRKNAMYVSWNGWLSLLGGIVAPVARFEGKDPEDTSVGLTVQYGAKIGGTCTAGGWANGSDRRIKEHIEYLEDDEATLDFMRNLKPVLYERSGERELGFYAQDVQAAEPDGWDTNIVSSSPFPGYDFDIMTLSYTELIAPLVAYAQSLEKRIDELEARLDGISQ